MEVITLSSVWHLPWPPQPAAAKAVWTSSLNTTLRSYRTGGGSHLLENWSWRTDVYARRRPLEAATITDRRLIIWPRSFTLNTEDGYVRVVDATGRIAARVGDHVRFGGSFSSPQSARLRELERELPRGCTGPFMSVGEVTAIIPDEPTTLTLQLPDRELVFPRQMTYLGSPTAMTALASRRRANGLGR